MNFQERCAHVSQLLQQLQAVVSALDRDACDLEVTHNDEPLLVRMVQGFLVCNRLSEEILYDQIPHIEQEMFSVGTALRLAHDEIMKRARGAHTDMEVYTKRRSRPRVSHMLHAIG